MPLIKRTKIPPGGWEYKETTGWPLPTDARYMPFSEAVHVILVYRENNARYGLSLVFADAAHDLEEYTCKRLPNFCLPSREIIQARLNAEAAMARSCAGCGLKRK